MQDGPKTMQIWKPKEKDHHTLQLDNDQNNTTGATISISNVHNTWKWIKKSTKVLDVTEHHRLKAKQKKNPLSLVMKIRIRHLQVLLFGINSIKTPFKMPGIQPTAQLCN